ncbi:hypothetical protein ACSSS7_004322 [Eimeria intestinalis]
MPRSRSPRDRLLTAASGAAASSLAADSNKHILSSSSSSSSLITGSSTSNRTRCASGSSWTSTSRGGGSLQALIKGLRSAQQQQQEAEFVASSLQQVKNELSAASGSGSSSSGSNAAAAARSLALQKLLYLQMLGVDVSFAAFSIIEGMAAHKYSLKRPAYAAAAIAFAAGSAAAATAADSAKSKQQQQQQQWPLAELSLLTINLFKKDLASRQMFETGLALQTLCCVSLSKEMVGALLPDLLTLVGSSRPYIRRKAALCCCSFLLQQLREQQQQQQHKMQQRLHLMSPSAAAAAAAAAADDSSSVLQPVLQKLQQQLMQEQDMGVICCIVTALLQAAATDPYPFLPLVPPLFHLLCSSSSNWLSIKLLQLLLLLSGAEPRLPQKLVKPLTLLLQQTKAKSVEVEALRLALLYAPFEAAAAAAAAAAATEVAAAEQAAAAMTEDAAAADSSSNSTMAPEELLLRLVCRRLHALLASPDHNIRFLALHLLHRTFTKRRQLVQPLLQLLPDLQQHLVQSAKEPDSSLRRVGVSLLASAASAATFPAVCERLLAAAYDTDRSARTTTSSGSSSSGTKAIAAAPLVSPADFILPLLQMAVESDYELVEDFEWYVALLADVACYGCSKNSSSSSSDAAVAAAVAKQLLDISVRVPEVRPCCTHLCMLLLETAAAATRSKSRSSSSSSNSSNSLQVLKALRQQHKEAHTSTDAFDDGAFASSSNSSSATATPSQVFIHHEIVRAAGWIGEDPSLGASTRRVLLWGGCKAYLSLTAVAQGLPLLQQGEHQQQQQQQEDTEPLMDPQETDTAVWRQTAAAAVQRLKPKLLQGAQAALRSTDAEVVYQSLSLHLDPSVFSVLLMSRFLSGTTGSERGVPFQMIPTVLLLLLLLLSCCRCWRPICRRFVCLRGEKCVVFAPVSFAACLRKLQLQPPAELELDKPFLDAAALQQQLDARMKQQKQQQQHQQQQQQQYSNGLTDNNTRLAGQSSTFLQEQQQQQQQQQAPWASSGGKKKFNVIRGAIAPKTSAALQQNAAANAAAHPAASTAAAAGGHSLGASATADTPKPQRQEHVSAAPAAAEKERQQQQLLQQRLMSRCGRNSVVEMFGCCSLSLQRIEGDTAYLPIFVCCSFAGSSNSGNEAVGPARLTFEAAAASLCVSEVSAVVCESPGQRSGVVEIEIPVSLTGLKRAARSGVGALCLRGRLTHALAGAPPDALQQQQQRQQQQEVEVVVPVPLSVALQPLRHTPESLGHFMASEGGKLTQQSSATASLPLSSLSQSSLFPAVPEGPAAAAKHLIALLAAAANMQLVEVQETHATDAGPWRVKGLLAAALQQQQQQQQDIFVALVSCSAAEETAEPSLQVRLAVRGGDEQTACLAEALKSILSGIASPAQQQPQEAPLQAA